MLVYFILQLTTIGFEKQYEKYKKFNKHQITWVLIFISCFFMYFYFTLSLSRMFDIEEVEEKKKKLEAISRLSNEILSGIWGILLFNGVFSLIFSSFYLSYMSEEVKSYIFQDNINIILMPILMTKFYYFTLNFYCTSTSEDIKKFEIISSSTLISFYIFVWNFIMSLIKSSIPEQKSDDDYNYYNILYIIQIIFSAIPALIVVSFIIIGICKTIGIFDFLYDGCYCDDCKQNFTIHKFLFCIFSFFFCLGGLWMKFVDFNEYQYDCGNLGDCCHFSDELCQVSCIENTVFCYCCCCKKNNCCYSTYCNTNCYTCIICGCCHSNEFNY